LASSRAKGNGSDSNSVPVNITPRNATAAPAYTNLPPGELEERANRLWGMLRRCRVCPQLCDTDRLEGKPGFCRVLDKPVVADYGPHFGEERPLVGHGGSGTIFMGGCNLSCVYCQNYDISQAPGHRPVSFERVAGMMLSLQERGCENINIVSPSHVVPHFVRALMIAAREDLRLPIVYNSGGYDSVDTLRLLDGIVDIYMPDMKYADPEVAERLSCAPDYPRINREAVREMHRQVGDLVVGDDGIARRGLLVRHLVLPQGLAGTEEIVRFLSREISTNTCINVMAQYYPAYKAHRHPPLDRGLRHHEYEQAVRAAEAEGLRLC